MRRRECSEAVRWGTGCVRASAGLLENLAAGGRRNLSPTVRARGARKSQGLRTTSASRVAVDAVR